MDSQVENQQKLTKNKSFKFRICHRIMLTLCLSFRLKASHFTCTYDPRSCTVMKIYEHTGKGHPPQTQDLSFREESLG